MERRTFIQSAVAAFLAPFAVEGVFQQDTSNAWFSETLTTDATTWRTHEVYDYITLNKGTYYVSAETGNFDTFESDGTNMIELGKGLKRDGKPKNINIWRLS